MIPLLVLAIAPSFLLVIFIYIKDKYDKEPKLAVLKAFVLGMLGVIPAIIIELIFDSFVSEKQNLILLFFYTFIAIALVEESVKFFIVKWFCFNRPYFNEVFDGIVYTATVSLGFACLENVGYVIEYGYEVVFVRAILAVPGHATWGLMMGYFIGLAKFNPEKRNMLFLKGLMLATLMHGIYDFLLLSENEIFMVIFVPFIFFMWWFGYREMMKARKSDEKRMSEEAILLEEQRNNKVDLEDNNLI